MMNTEQQITVLLIDDDARESRLIQDKLAQAEDASFDVKWARQLPTGLEHLAQEDFDVVLLDLSRPDVIAKVHDKAPDMPLVVLADTMEGAKLLAEGAQDFIPKRRLNASVLAHSLTHAIERSAVGEETRRTDRRFRALVENAKDAIVVIDSAGTVIYDSPAFKGILGYQEGENLGLRGFDFIHPEDMEATMNVMGQILANPGVAFPNPIRVKHKDGSWHFVETLGTNCLHDPAVGGIVTNLRDVTDRKKAEEKFRNEMEFYKRLIELTPDGPMVVAADATLLYQSPASERIFGIKPETRTGQTAWNFIHPDDISRLAQAYAEAMSKPGGSTTVVGRAVLEDGSPLWVEAAGTNCLDDPALKGAVVVFKDITEFKNMEEKLQHSQNELKQALAKFRQVLEERSTPVLQLWNNVLALPLIGAIDDQRAQQMMELLLTRIVQTQSELVIVDVTGVPSMDSMVTNHLIKTMKSASMLGAQCILTGMRPEVAHSVIRLEVDLSTLVIKRDMQEGLQWALEWMEAQSDDGHSPTEAHAPEQAQAASLRKGTVPVKYGSRPLRDAALLRDTAREKAR